MEDFYLIGKSSKKARITTNQVKKQESRRDKPVLAMGQEGTVWMDHGMGSYVHILIQDKRCFDEGFFLLILIITINLNKK